MKNRFAHLPARVSARKIRAARARAPHVTRAVQLEWNFFETPAPRARFLNFPFVDAAPTRLPQSVRAEKRPLAA